MLNCLRIRDLAIIDELELGFGTGLNVLTGETGAGKSILVGALGLLLGGKARADLVRLGAGQAEVEGLFEIREDEGFRERLRSLSLPEEELVVRRVVSSCGRTRAFINGKLVTQQVLAEVVRGLVDVSSQHEHHGLTDPAVHLNLLDSFAGVHAERRQMAAAVARLRQAELGVRELEVKLSSQESRRVFLRAQIEDVESVAPRPGEELELEQVRARLRSLDALLRLAGQAADSLYEQDSSARDVLARAAGWLADAAVLDATLCGLAQQLDVLCDQLDELGRDLGRYLNGLRADPDELARTEDRLQELGRLQRRYGGNLESVIHGLAACKAELDILERPGEVRQALSLELERALEEAHHLAAQLSAARVQAASRLGVAIGHELEMLGMAGARVLVQLTPNGATPGGNGDAWIGGARLTPQGRERAELMIMPNPGEEVRPLRQVGSGGELSRVLLALKCVLAGLGPAGLYVFDEIDTGVGGRMGEIVGRKIARVAQQRQVLCITHLAQIAVFADRHFKVEKVTCADRTVSRVRQLGVRERSEEIARMLGGMVITARTRAAARELLGQARQSAA
jgi:DNA repair protein RecN (Recombination protein N)